MAVSAHLDIVSAEAQLFSGLVEMVIVSGERGELGILPGHAALLSPIKPGQIRVIRQGGIEDVYYVSGGILEVQPDVVTILADTVARAADLDEAQALAARQRAVSLLADKKANVEITGALIELAKATAQLRALNAVRKK
jgi:F-type H+-transporting ATPase subunit epsilon